MHSHVKFLQAIIKHVFPADNPLLKQKSFMHNHMFLHLSDRTISEFHARWIQLNNYHNEFPPFKPNQHFTEDETKSIFYNIIPKCWQSYMQWDNFYTIQHSVKYFFDMMEHYQLTDQLHPPPKQNQTKNNTNDSKKSTEKSNNIKHKAKLKKNDSDLLAPKKACMLHGPDSSHMSNEC